MTLPRCTHAPKGAAAAAAARIRATIPRIETARLVLRAPVVGDFPIWAEIFAAPDSHFMGGPCVGEAAWAEFTGYVAGWLLQGHGLWAVERRDDEKLVGFVSLGLEWDDYEPELGWMLVADARGRGYATEATAAARAYALSLIGDEGCVSYIDPENARSIRVAERIGGTLDASAARSDDIDLVYRHGVPA